MLWFLTKIDDFAYFLSTLWYDYNMWQCNILSTLFIINNINVFCSLVSCCLVRVFAFLLLVKMSTSGCIKHNHLVFFLAVTYLICTVLLQSLKTPSSLKEWMLNCVLSGVVLAWVLSANKSNWKSHKLKQQIIFYVYVLAQWT